MVDDDIRKGIEKIISNYEYGQFNILEGNTKMEYDLDSRKISFQNFYKHDYLLNKDTCLGLMCKAYNDIRLTYRNLFVARTFGNDDTYFKNYGSNHCFLLVNTVDMMNYCSTVNDKKGLLHAFNTNPLIVDPSFKKVMNASDSGYIINSLMNSSCTLDCGNAQTLNSGDGGKFLPLILNDAKEILYLAPDFNSKHFMAIGIQKQNMNFKDIPLYPLESPKLDELYANDKKSYQFIEQFRNMSKTKISK